MNEQNMRTKINNGLISIIKWIELILALFIAIAVIISIKDIITFIHEIYVMKGIDSYELFNTFLANVLLLVIGLELIETLIRHTPASIIEVLIYAIARKMLVHSANAYELLAGAAAITILFAAKNFFVQQKDN